MNLDEGKERIEVECEEKKNPIIITNNQSNTFSNLFYTYLLRDPYLKVSAQVLNLTMLIQCEGKKME